MSKSCQYVYLLRVLRISLFNYKFIIFISSVESRSYNFSKYIVLADFSAYNEINFNLIHNAHVE